MKRITLLVLLVFVAVVLAGCGGDGVEEGDIVKVISPNGAHLESNSCPDCGCTVPQGTSLVVKGVNTYNVGGASEMLRTDIEVTYDRGILGKCTGWENINNFEVEYEKVGD